ncbi:hypothetical protein PRUPE_3G229700 [Prunus persica]|uniref:Wound-responsive family protein n=1 Tax=Prunus persica TaxID=3760 RepID=A0A251Q4A9_PRUPE|nr:hypothetical protein PRUPE_3G229700 [Prunus persica]
MSSSYFITYFDFTLLIIIFSINNTLKTFTFTAEEFKRFKREIVERRKEIIIMMSSTSVGVEALKDQGICRWNSALRSVHQQAKTQLRSFSQLSSSSASAAFSTAGDEKLKKSEESLRTVMYLSCWGPN